MLSKCLDHIKIRREFDASVQQHEHDVLNQGAHFGEFKRRPKANALNPDENVYKNSLALTSLMINQFDVEF